jgi:hypothetical protein
MNPALNPVLVREAALIAGVCARPVVAQVTDTESGEVRIVPMSCGSTREDRCPPCADRAKRLRIQQCREGWHLDTEPEWAGPDGEGDDQADDQPTRPGGGCGRPGGVRTHRTCRGCRWRTGPSAVYSRRDDDGQDDGEG